MEMAQENQAAQSSDILNNILLILAALGDYTTVYAVIFGHFDSFGNDTDGNLIENKISGVLGTPTSLLLEDSAQDGPVPPGALVYPQYKVATLSRALSDIELHVLHSDVHMGSHQQSADGIIVSHA